MPLFTIPDWGLGDKLCLVSAARLYARLHPEEKTSVKITPPLRNGPDVIPALVAAYKDSLLAPPEQAGSEEISLQAAASAGGRSPLAAGNQTYYGIFLAAMGCLENAEPFATPELPRVTPRFPGRVIIQLRSHFARNPPASFLLQVANTVCDELGIEPIAVGLPSGRDAFPGLPVDYSFMKDDVVGLLEAISGAGLVLTPRSASVHIAAGYNVPTCMWSPPDNENWGYRYSGRTILQSPFGSFEFDELRTLLRQLKRAGKLLSA